MSKFYYHTRHIPEEQLNLDTPAGKKVKEELLCDVMDYADNLHEYGIDTVETRLIWWELEKEPGKYDWSVLEKRIARIEKAEIEPCVFPWFMHAPEWEHELVRAKCIEHGEESSIISMWEPKLLEVYDRLYGALAKEYGERIKFLYFSFYGDFGEPQYLHNTAHYKFSSPHAHYGYWCGDDLARADFKKHLQAKYDSIDALNKAWETEISDWDADLMPPLPIVSNSLQRRIDFRDWYTTALIEFIDKVGAIIRKHFPNHRGGFPMGGDRERLNLGQVKSRVIKRIAKKYNVLVRWTALGNEFDYGVIDFQARRVSSAVNFYSKRGFGSEASLGISPELAYHTVYVNISNGSSLLHNEMSSMKRGWEDYKEWMGKIPVLEAESDIAVFYPVEGEQLECMTPERAKALPDGVDIGINDKPGPDTELLYNNASKFREICHYEVVDSCMIEDGILDRIKDLVIVCTCPIPENTWAIIMKWVENGGRLWYKNDSMPWILETAENITDKADVKTEAGEEKGIYSVDEWPEFEPYASIIKKHREADEQVFVTLHGSKYSVYIPSKKKIVIEDR